MKKINITTARKLFNKGEKIYVLPNKVALGNPWISPSLIGKINDETFDYIINATPVGMYPNIEECPELPYEAMTEKNILYDLIYNPDQTKFMKLGAKQGATVKNGLEMLLLQAFASWEFWNR